VSLPEVVSAEVDGRSPLDAAEALVPLVRAHADEGERERRLPEVVAAALARAGVFRLCVPRALGGIEAAPQVLIRVLETIATADGAAGWCAMIGATSGVVSAYLPDEAAAEMYGRDPLTISGGVFAPMGRAESVDGGYRATGRWPFASGCEHCNWLMGGCLLVDGIEPRRLPNGAPDARLLLFPAADVRIIDTWSVAGLQGTGSHDITVAELFVPAERVVSLMVDRPRHPGPLFVFPVFGLLAVGIAAVALGIARRAIDELTRLAVDKVPTGSRRRLGERALIQVDVAQAEATLRSARAFLDEIIEQTWGDAVQRGSISLEQRALLRLAATHATTSAAQVVDRMYHAGGGTAVYHASVLQRQFRDIHVATQHAMVGTPTYELAGRVLLGIDTDTSQL
jgi:alkylation response protein AidB-like acyl-CoA dehydrogenase